MKKNPYLCSVQACISLEFSRFAIPGEQLPGIYRNFGCAEVTCTQKSSNIFGFSYVFS